MTGSVTLIFCLDNGMDLCTPHCLISVVERTPHTPAAVFWVSVYVDSAFLISHTVVAIQLHVLYT